MIAALLLYLPWLALTLAIEVAVVAQVAPGREPRRVCAALNLCTHPFATLLLVASRGASFGLCELAVALFEGLGYARLLGMPLRRAVPLSLAANVVSTIAGFLLAIVVERR